MAGLVWGPNDGTAMTLCTIRKPFIWHRDVVPIASVEHLVHRLESSTDVLQKSDDDF